MFSLLRGASAALRQREAHSAVLAEVFGLPAAFSLATATSDQRREWDRRLGGRLGELLSLAQERDAGMFYEGLAQLGRRLEGDGREDVAREIYTAIVAARPPLPGPPPPGGRGLMSEDPQNFPSPLVGEGPRRGGEGETPAHIRTLAQERLHALNGGGGFGQQAERFVRRAPEETFHSSMFLGFIPTMMAGKVLRLGALSWLYRNPAVKLWTRGWGVEATAGLMSVLGEAAVLPVATRVGALALGEKLSWEPEQLRQEAWGSLLFLGGMRLVTVGAGLVPARGKALLGAVGPRGAGPLLGGIALGQQFETWAGLRAPTEGSARLFEILSTYGQIWGAGVLAGGVLGHHFVLWERAAEARVEAMKGSALRVGTPLIPETVSALAGGARTTPRIMLDKNPGPLAEFNPRMSSRNSGNRRSRPQRYPLRPVLSQVKNLPTPQAVAYALRWIYTGIMGPLRARIFYSLDAVEGGASPQVILPALFEGSELGKTLFFTAGVRNQIAAKIKRLSRGEDPESIDKEIPISPSTSVGSPGGSRRQHYEHLSSEEVVRLNLIRSEMLVGAYRGKKKALPIPASRILQEALGLQRNLNNVTRRTIMQADKDTLTGLSNRGYWERQIPYMQKRLLSQGSVGRRSDWILMIDIDHFKKVNDTYGHTPNGDEALWTVAQVITQIVEDRHTVARFGGEEFVIYLFNSGHEGAQKVAEEIRQAVEKTDIEIKEVPGVNSIRVTVSVGGAEMRMLPPSETPGKLTAEGAVEDAMHRADEHLYHAKENGRNRVHIPKTS